MVKPIDFEELLLRVRALLRRANIEMEKKLTVGNLVLDGDGMTAEVDGEDIPVTPREFNILFKLLSYPKKIFSRAQLMDEFWEVDTDASLCCPIRKRYSHAPSSWMNFGKWTQTPACARWMCM